MNVMNECFWMFMLWMSCGCWLELHKEIWFYVKVSILFHNSTWTLLLVTYSILIRCFLYYCLWSNWDKPFVVLAEIMTLQSKFEEDKKRLQQMRAARKFRPYWTMFFASKVQFFFFFWSIPILSKMVVHLV